MENTNKKLLIVSEHRDVMNLEVQDLLVDYFEGSRSLDYDEIEESVKKIKDSDVIISYIGDNSSRTLFFLGVAYGLEKEIILFVDNDTVKLEDTIYHILDMYPKYNISIDLGKVKEMLK